MIREQSNPNMQIMLSNTLHQKICNYLDDVIFQNILLQAPSLVVRAFLRKSNLIWHYHTTQPARELGPGNGRLPEQEDFFIENLRLIQNEVQGLVILYLRESYERG